MDNRHEVICAWCKVVTGYSDVKNSHGICSSCMNVILQLPNLSYDELNNLPFGIVSLTQDGTITFYNESEEKLSDRKADEVINRNFFTDVAPCTKVKEFYGQFQEFLLSPKFTKDFSFTFYFPNKKVMVEIVFIKHTQDEVMVIIKKDENQ